MKLRGIDSPLLRKYEKDKTGKKAMHRDSIIRMQPWKEKWKSVKEEEKTLCSAPTKASSHPNPQKMLQIFMNQKEESVHGFFGDILHMNKSQSSHSCPQFLSCVEAFFVASSYHELRVEP